MKSQLLKFSIGLAISLAGGLAQSSTFVGNGGNAGDIELQVTRREIIETLSLIEQNKSSPDLKLCRCYDEMQGHPICDVLKKLTEPQVQTCSKFLIENASALSSALSKAFIRWNSGNMEVLDRQELMSVDAVTHFQTQQITLHQTRFLDMKNYERVFLLTHETGHLLNLNGQPLQDNQAVDTFTGNDGGRQLLNAIAAAAVMESLDTGVLAKYQHHLKRSQGRANIWFEAAIADSKTKEQSFAVADKKGGNFGIYYFFASPWGVTLQYQSREGKTDILTQSSAKESTRAVFAGISYQFFPGSDPLSYIGQSHFKLSVGAENLQSRYEVKDNFISAEETANSTAAAINLAYYFPLQAGFWIYAQAGYVDHKYRIEIPFKTIEMNAVVNMALGVSYGF